MAVHEAFVYLGSRDAIDFYRAAFGAIETFRLADPSGRIGHAELSFGASTSS